MCILRIKEYPDEGYQLFQPFDETVSNAFEELKKCGYVHNLREAKKPIGITGCERLGQPLH